MTGIKYVDYAILIAIILLASFVILKVLRFFLDRYLKKSSEQLNVDSTQYYFLKNALNFIIVLGGVLVILFSIPELRQIGVTLFAGAGIFAAIIGFASQAAFSNIVSGIFIVIFKPFRVRDIIKISDKYTGVVEDITLRHVVIRDFENKRYIIPNSVISTEVIHNFMIGDEKINNMIYFRVSYSANLDRAIEIIREEAENHPNFIDNRLPEDIEKDLPRVGIRVMDWGEYSIQIRAMVWSENPAKAFELKTDILKFIKERFDAEGIEIPYPYRNVVMKNNNG